MVAKRVFSALPEELRYAAIVLSRLGGKVPRECPVCGYEGKFAAAGQPPRYDSVCKQCGSRERHRLFVKALRDMELDGLGEILHFAPDRSLIPMLRGMGSYTSADLRPEVGDLVPNVERIEQPDNHWDTIIANQILEHVDDRKALAEFYRILKPGGLLIVTVPIIEGWDTTYENPAVKNRAERTLHFGQGDHVRYFGRDFRDRLTGAGFDLTEYAANGEDCVRYGLIRGERIFFGNKKP